MIRSSGRQFELLIEWKGYVHWALSIVSLSLRCAEAVMKSSWTPSQRSCDRGSGGCHFGSAGRMTHTQTQRYALKHTYAQRRQQRAVARSLFHTVLDLPPGIGTNIQQLFSSVIYCFPLYIYSSRATADMKLEVVNFILELIWGTSSWRQNSSLWTLKTAVWASLSSLWYGSTSSGRYIWFLSFRLQALNLNGRPNCTNG